MTANQRQFPEKVFSRFDRKFFDSPEAFTYLGSGELGGKARGLGSIREKVLENFPYDRFPGITINVPRMLVLTTTCFDQFIACNNLSEIAYGDMTDNRIAHYFIRAEIPPLIAGDLREVANSVSVPLAIRSSSLLEDAMFAPFAGIYGTKMIPNNQADSQVRYQKLSEAVKFVFASTFFKDAKDYIKTTKHHTEEEKMAVIIQEVVGKRYGDRFYPVMSGVARSYNFYSRGKAKPKDGVVDLALGLGKTIVDGGLAWTYSPTFPRAKPPVSSARDFVRQTQSQFWAVNMGNPPAYDPIREDEYLVQATISDADYDGTLEYVASTYDAESDIIVPGVSSIGPRIINFSPILDIGILPINNIVKTILKLCEEAVGSEVEIEFAMTLDRHGENVRFGLLQVRPMVVSHDQIDISDEELAASNKLTAAETVLGNGVEDRIRDIVYVRPDTFDAKNTRAIAQQLELINRQMVEEKTPYLLIGFGRWGSSDPWLGIPVNWGQICGAKVIVESTLPNMYIDLSQGSHFFHNITSFQVSYFSISHAGKYGIDWDWLAEQPSVSETELLRHVRTDKPILVRVDGRTGRGVILR